MAQHHVPGRGSGFLVAAAGYLALALGAAVLVFSGAAGSMDRAWMDASFASLRAWLPQAVNQDVVVVGIDEAFLETVEEPLALSHAYLARFLDIATSARPRVVALDLVLPEKRFDTLVPRDSPGTDFHRILLAGILRTTTTTPLVVGKAWDPDRGHFRDIQLDYAALLAMQEGPFEAQASVLLCRDPDGRIRRYPGADCQPDRRANTFASEISAAMGNRQDWSGLIDYRQGPEFAYVPLQDVFALAEAGDTARLADLFEAKGVVLGTVLEDTDLVEVPVPLAEWRPGNRRVPGVLVHAQILRNMLNHGLVVPVPAPWVLLASLVAALLWFGRAMVWKSALLVTTGLALLATSWALLANGYWFPPAAPLLTGLAAFGASSFLQGRRQLREKRELSRMFAGYASPAILAQIATSDLAGAEARSRHLCVLACDLRSFAHARGHDTRALVHGLNRAYSLMAAVVHRHRGTVDRFGSGGMLAFFGAPGPLVLPEVNAFEAANEMLVALEPLAGSLQADGLPPLHPRCAIHSGDAVLGYFGSDERHDYTAMGEVTTLPWRMLAATQHDASAFGLLVSADVARALGEPSFLVAAGRLDLPGGESLPLFGWTPTRVVAVAPAAAAPR